MGIRSKYLMAFFSATCITLILVAISLWGFYALQQTTDYLVTVNNKVLEYSNAFDKELAHSRRAEKEFFIFPGNDAKQNKYIQSWTERYGKGKDYLNKLEAIFLTEKNREMLAEVNRAKEIMGENIKLWDIVVAKFKETQQYDDVNKAEYGEFKKKTHLLEDIAVKMNMHGLAEVERGSQKLAGTQKKTQWLIWTISLVAILWGVIIPIILSKRLTDKIVYLTDISNSISKGKINEKIALKSKDELGDLANSIQRMQTSLKILLKRFKAQTSNRKAASRA